MVKKTRAAMTIHGFLADVNDFGVLYDQLAPFYDHIEKCKIPGHNEPVNFKLFKMQQTFDAVFQTFDSLKSRYDEVDVIGHSMGGALASMLAASRQINKLVLLAPANKYINAQSFFNHTRYYFKSFRDAYNSIDGKVSERWKYAEAAMKTYHENSKISINWAFTKFIPHLSLSTFSVFRQIISQCNKCLMEAKTLLVPTLLMWGELDELVPSTSLDFLQQIFKNSQKILYPNVGHAMTMTNQGKIICHDIICFLTDKKLPKRRKIVRKLKKLHRKQSQTLDIRK